MNSPRMREASPRRWLARGCDPRGNHAFTLLEILVVLAIMGLLTGLIVVNIQRAHANAEKAAARLMIDSSLKSALNLYRISVHNFPSTAEGLNALVTRPASNSPLWGGPYIEGKVPLDPWGEPYHYESPGTHNKESFDLWSSGPDRQTGTEDDIANWDTPRRS